MKKVFLTIIVFAFIANVSAQLKVSSTGDVGIKLPNITDIPLSPLSIGGVGNSDYLASLTGNEKNVILNVSNPTPVYLNSVGYGIRSSVNIVNSSQATVAVGIQERGEGVHTLYGSELKAGIYLYSLIADGQEVDMKRMILTK
ncbi:MAG: hypothetical protein LBG15_14285 [Dysgonamonadaceae bacterium]|jgi:hypothetical protein|nr:hypothetical protein [Dysgonamonadaceae bacterium]